MSKICEHCNHKVGFMDSEPLYLTNEKILCNKCAVVISDDIDALYDVETKEDFAKLKNKIISNSKLNFGDNVTEYIIIKINKIYERLNFLQNTVGDGNDGYMVNQGSDDSSGMFDNIGKKIKILAKIFTWIGIIASVISGISIISIDPDDMGLLGVIVMIVGAILSWISSFVLYGFGQLVDNSDKIVSAMKKE